MQNPYHRLPGDHLGGDDDDIRAAVRFAVVVAAAAMAFVAFGAFWASMCDGTRALDTVTCGRPERTLLGFGAPLILLAGGLRAFLRTYRVWRRGGSWWGWQGAGWLLLTLMALTLTMGLPLIAGPALVG